MNALSELFMAWLVGCVLSNAKYLLLPTVPTTMEPKKLIREERVHAQISKTVLGPKRILFWGNVKIQLILHALDLNNLTEQYRALNWYCTYGVMHAESIGSITTQESRYLYLQRMLTACLYPRHKPSHHEHPAIHCPTSGNFPCDYTEFVLATWRTTYSAFLLSLS